MIAMDTVLAVLVAACLAGFVWPQIVRHRGHFFLAVAAVGVGLLLQGCSLVLALARAGEMAAFLAFVATAMHLAAFLFLALGVGGLGFSELLAEIGAGFRGLQSVGPRGFPMNPPPPPPPGR